MNSVRCGHSACVRLLLDLGADVSLISASGNTAWSLALCAEETQPEIIQWIAEETEKRAAETVKTSQLNTTTDTDTDTTTPPNPIE